MCVKEKDRGRKRERYGKETEIEKKRQREIDRVERR